MFSKIETSTRVWLILLVLTFLSWQLAGQHLLGWILLFTALKAELIGAYFMRLKYAPLLWRILLWIWLTIVLGGIAIAYSL